MMNSNLLRMAFAVFIVSMFILPITVPAQNRSSPEKVKPRKPIRVFYGLASFYANKFEGRRTANGDTFRQKKLTCACNVLPLGTWVKVTNLRNGRSVVVKINDRIHPRMNRVVDLSKLAAEKLNFISRGITKVKVEVIGKKNTQ
jgi:rare lipoprotein A